MYPIETPHDICSEVEWATSFPIVVDIIAHVFNFFGNHVRPWGLVPASANLDIGRSKIACVGAQALKRDSLQMKQVGGTQFERPLPIGVGLNHVRNGVELTDTVVSLYFGDLVGIGNDLSFERLAMPGVIVAPHSRLFRTTRWFLGLAEGIGCAIDHLTGDARVLNFGVAVGKAPPLLLFLLGSRNNFFRSLKQIFEMFGHGLPPVSLEGQYHNKPLGKLRFVAEMQGRAKLVPERVRFHASERAKGGAPVGYL